MTSTTTKPFVGSIHEERTTVAYHEAGHAAMAYLFRLPIIDLSIKPDEDNYVQGCVRLAAKPTKRRIFIECDDGSFRLNRNIIQLADGSFEPKENIPVRRRSRIQIEKEIVILLAGGLVEMILQGSFIEHPGGSSLDLSEAHRLALENAPRWHCLPDSFFTRLQIESMYLVDYSWQMIDSLAQALLEREALSGRDAIRVLRESHETYDQKIVISSHGELSSYVIVEGEV